MLPMRGEVASPTVAIPTVPMRPRPRAPERGTRSETTPSMVGQK